MGKLGGCMTRVPKTRVGQWWSDIGASASEMALMLLLVVIVAFGAVQLFGHQVEDLWQQSADGSDGTVTPQPAEADDGGGGGGDNSGGGGSGLPVPTSTTTTTTTAP